MARTKNLLSTLALVGALSISLVLPSAATAATSSSGTTASKSSKSKSTKAAKAKAKPKVAAKSKGATAKKAKTRVKTKAVAVSSRSTATAHIRNASFGPSDAIERTEPGRLALRSSVAFVQDLSSSDVLFAKNDGAVLPIASITKLMTALVVVDAQQPLDEEIEITTEDIDQLKHTHSRLVVGTRLPRADMLHLALMSSENRAANALGRNYPGGLRAFVEAMNAKAALLGMRDTHYVEPTGLSSSNVSSPRDLVRLMQIAAERPLIHQYTTSTELAVEIAGRQQMFRNTNRLVSRPDWDIQVSKTGFINEAGQCLIMLAKIGGRDLAIVLLDSVGSLTRTADAVRIRQWLQSDLGSTL